MRPLAVLALLAVAAPGAETQPYPLWDGQETIEQYARRAKLEPTQTLDLGNGVKLELVLIPAGKFTMGTPEPRPVDEVSFRQKIIIGQAVLGAGAGVLLILLGTVVVRATRRRGRPQYSLGRLLVMTMVAGVALLGGLHWHFSARGLTDAKAEYQAAVARHNEASETEKAAHEVTISKPYYLGKFEVTQEQYQQVMGVNPSQYKGRDLPAECVWNDAREFCRKASAKTGLTVRLPTDAEWEHACRAGTRTTYYTGDAETDLDRAAWYFKNSNDTTHSVGQKTPNAWGLYDMHGNVWEWCQGFHDPYSAEASADPQGPAQGAGPVLRGGCLYDEPGLCRSARRYTPVPGMRPFSPGLRVVVGVSHRTP